MYGIEVHGNFHKLLYSSNANVLTSSQSGILHPVSSTNSVTHVTNINSATTNDGTTSLPVRSSTSKIIKRLFEENIDYKGIFLPFPFTKLVSHSFCKFAEFIVEFLKLHRFFVTPDYLLKTLIQRYSSYSSDVQVIYKTRTRVLEIMNLWFSEFFPDHWMYKELLLNARSFINNITTNNDHPEIRPSEHIPLKHILSSLLKVFFLPFTRFSLKFILLYFILF